jgi:hypothetical protein
MTVGRVLPVHDETREHARPAAHRRFGLDVVACVVLYALVAVVYLLVVRSADVQQMLTGEEATVTFVDPVALEQRFQYTHYSTNFGGHVFFWLASLLDPSFDLFYGRAAKALALAFAAPLIYLTLRRRLGTARVPAVVGALTGALLPGVVSFSWVGIETGLDSVLGLAGLLVATTARRWWWLAPVLAGLAVSSYGGGIPWAAAIGAVALARLVVSLRRREFVPAALLVVAGLAGIGVIVFPLLWWGGGVVLSGGGTLGLAGARGALTGLARELAVAGDSYYYFTSQAALGSTALAVVVLVAMVVMVVRRPGSWPWLLVVVVTLALYAVSGGVLGVRRAVSIPLIGAIAIGYLVDRIRSRAQDRSRILAAVSVAVAAVALIAPLAVQVQQNRVALSSGEEALPRDFVFPGAEGETMPQTLDRLADRIREDPAAMDRIATEFEAERAFSMILLLDERGAIAPTPLTGRIVEDYYFVGPRCDLVCGERVDGRP